MFRPRPRRIAFAIITPCLATLLFTAPLGEIRGDGAASAANGAGAGWQPASVQRNRSLKSNSSEPIVTAPTSSPVATQKPTARWQLPNTTSKPAAANPAIGKRASSAAAQEPRAFLPSGELAPMRTAQHGGSAAASSVLKSSSSAAVSQSSTGMRAGSAATMNVTSASVPANRSQQAGRPVQASAESKSYRSKVWDTVQVAFQGPDVWTGEAENLPMPGTSSPAGRHIEPPHEMHDGMMYDEHGYIEHEGDMHMPYGGPSDCSDGSCSSFPGDGCACGCTEAGCSCEPGCACQSGESPCIVACGDDVCLMGQGDAEACHTIRIGVPKWQELMVFGGVHGFKGPYDRTRDSGNFGFNEGFNAGFKVPFSSMGYQIGYRATHSQLNGDKDTNISDPHTQQFITVGAFQRVKDGVQFGIAWDMLRDERFGAVDFHQLRSELSLIDRGCHELGIGVTVHMNEHEPFPATDEDPSVIYQASDQYLLFYRMHGARGGEGRFYGGFNDDEDGIIGADLLLPIKDRWSVQTGFTYLIPDEPAGRQGATQEAWNIGLALVWHWDCRARSCHSNCYRPMFNVADNGYLIVDERLGAPATD